MENNEGHKLDSFFKINLENNESLPPEIAWKNIYANTIGRETIQPKPLWIYALVAIFTLLISGFGTWYYAQSKFENPKAVAIITIQKTVMSRSLSPLSVSSPLTISPKPIVTTLPPNRIFAVGTNGIRPRLVAGIPTSPQQQFDGIDREPLVIEVSDETTPANSDNFVAGGAYCSFPDWWILEEKIEPKNLVVSDLRIDIENISEKKILPFEQTVSEKIKHNQSDSVVYGKGFSLKHPIISLGMGTQWAFWNYNLQSRYFEGITFEGGRAGIAKIGIAWKLNKRLRMGFTLTSTAGSLGKPYSTSQIYSSSLGSIAPPDLRLAQIYSDQYYQAKTIFGNVNIPIEKFKDFPTKIPNIPDSTRAIFYKDEQSMTMMVFSVISQYDLISRQRKKGRKFSYQMYGLIDFMVQRQTHYQYRAYDIKTLSSSLGNNNFPNIFYDANHLENASLFVFGLRAGLGFRWQFARKWDIYVEGSAQNNLNSWVRSQDIKTYQKAVSLQWGLNLNL